MSEISKQTKGNPPKRGSHAVLRYLGSLLISFAQILASSILSPFKRSAMAVFSSVLMVWAIRAMHDGLITP
jgi:hypothetical protein